MRRVVKGAHLQCASNIFTRYALATTSAGQPRQKSENTARSLQVLVCKAGRLPAPNPLARAPKACHPHLATFWRVMTHDCPPPSRASTKQLRIQNWDAHAISPASVMRNSMSACHRISHNRNASPLLPRTPRTSFSLVLGYFSVNHRGEFI